MTASSRCSTDGFLFMEVYAFFDCMLCSDLLKLLESSRQECVDGVHADSQLIRNLSVLHCLQSEQQHLLFAPRQNAQIIGNYGQASRLVIRSPDIFVILELLVIESLLNVPV